MGFLTKNISFKGIEFKKRPCQAQSLLEYVMVVGIISMVLFAMAPLLREGVQSIIKVTADQFADQQDADQAQSNRRGYLVNSFTNVSPSSTSKTITDVVGDITYTYNDNVSIYSNSYTNLGFTNKVE